MRKALQIGALLVGLTVHSFVSAQEPTVDTPKYPNWGEGYFAGMGLSDEDFARDEKLILENLTNVKGKEGSSSAAWNLYSLGSWREERYNKHKDWLWENIRQEPYLCEYLGRSGVDKYGYSKEYLSEERYKDFKDKIGKCTSSSLEASIRAGEEWEKDHFEEFAGDITLRVTQGEEKVIIKDKKKVIKWVRGPYWSRWAGIYWKDDNFNVVVENPENLGMDVKKYDIDGDGKVIAGEILAKSVSSNKRSKDGAKKLWKEERRKYLK